MNGKITIEIEEATDYDGYLRIHIPEQAIVFRGNVDQDTFETVTLNLLYRIKKQMIKKTEKHFTKGRNVYSKNKRYNH